MSLVSLNENLLKSCILLAIFHGYFLKNSHPERLQTFNPKCYISTLKDRQGKKVILLLMLLREDECIYMPGFWAFTRSPSQREQKVRRYNGDITVPVSKTSPFQGQCKSSITEIISPSKQRQYYLGFIDHNYISTWSDQVPIKPGTVS